MLMTVSGVGASTARMIMSAFQASELRTLIATGNAKGLAQVKGLGPKTAQRIIVDLKDKVLKLDIDGSGNPNELPMEFAPEDNPVKSEAVSALTMLGFAPAPSQKVVVQILQEQPNAPVETVVKLALKQIK